MHALRWLRQMPRCAHLHEHVHSISSGSAGCVVLILLRGGGGREGAGVAKDADTRSANFILLDIKICAEQCASTLEPSMT